MLRKYTVRLEVPVVESFREEARLAAVARKSEVSWQDVLREAAAWYLASGAASRPAARPSRVTHGGAR